MLKFEAPLEHFILPLWHLKKMKTNKQNPARRQFLATAYLLLHATQQSL